MSKVRVIRAEWLYSGVIALLLVLHCFGRPTVVQAQTQICSSNEGYNAVYGNCNGQTGVVGSTALIDASAWCNGDCSQGDICKFIADAIAVLPSNVGGTVDARGVAYRGGETCTVNPFAQSSGNVPVTVLLPPDIISIQRTWILPSNTHIIGQGGNSQLIPTSKPPFTPDPNNPVPAMVEMGNASVCPSGCTGISIEHVKLDGALLTVNNVGLTGIYNNYAKDGSYVDDVSLYRISAVFNQPATTLTTGLLIDSGAAGSGPYTNISAAACRFAVVHRQQQSALV